MKRIILKIVVQIVGWTVMSENKKRIAYILLIFVFIISTGFALQAFQQPLQIEERVEENNISFKTTFEYKASVQPCTLYPQGGIVVPDEAIFSNITDKLLVKVNSTVEADKPVKVDGTKKVLLTLTADRYWERSFILEQDTPINLEGTINSIINKEYSINLVDIRNYIEQVAGELKLQPSSYLLRIRPILEGQVIYGEEKIQLDRELELTFDYTDSVIRLNKDAQLEFFKETPIIMSDIIEQSFILFGKEYPLVAARYTFSVISLGSLIFILVNLAKKIRIKRLMVTNITKIDKKYKGRIINLERELDVKDKICITIDSFKSLLKIADEREQPVFRKLASQDLAHYYVVDGDYIYKTEVRAKREKNIPKVGIKSWGSDPNHAK